MTFLLLNQTFHPDVVATAQYLTEVARGLADRGHEVSVISGRRAYDDPVHLFPSRERWSGIDIRRARSTRFGKKAKWRRALDFASFMASCTWELIRVRKPDVVVALTSPPLISFIAACYASMRRCDFVYWVMDLNPDEAIAAGWLRERSMVGRVLNWMSVFSFRSARHIVVLDRFMKQRLLEKGIDAAKVVVLPPWHQDDSVQFDAAGRESFRAAHGLNDKFVVMYSGNHSPCHPLATLFEAARAIASVDPHVMFCFIGGGSEFARVQQFAAEHALTNILCLPYQPLAKLSASLSAADLHVVVMGDPFVGTIHPCKVYNILGVQAPLLYIGPRESHVTDILAEAKDSPPALALSVRHGDVDALVRVIRSAAAAPHTRTAVPFLPRFSRQNLLPQLLDLLDGSSTVT